ncbi:3-oxoacyl-ACP synthase, partial [Campylobacter coli]|nr:3-oxoacyl-ACP synthase [Campylobacter coli]
ETLKNYGDITINKLAFDLANYEWRKGGGHKTSFYG